MEWEMGGKETVPRQSRRPGTGIVCFHSQEPRIRKLSLGLGCRGVWETGNHKKGRSSEQASPSCGTSSSHWPGGCGTGPRSLFCIEETGGESENDGAGVGGRDTLRMPRKGYDFRSPPSSPIGGPVWASSKSPVFRLHPHAHLSSLTGLPHCLNH